MMRIIPAVLLMLLAVPIGHSYSQYIDTTQSLKVSIDNEMPFMYRDDDGHAVVVGLLNNDNDGPVTSVTIRTIFYDETGTEQLDIVQGGSALQVIPGNSQSPYVMRSSTANPDIAHASVSILGFEPSAEKAERMVVTRTETYRDSMFHLAATIKNGPAHASNATAYLAFYDGFIPPRILDVSAVDIGAMLPDEERPMRLDRPLDSRAVGFLMFAESDRFLSMPLDAGIPDPEIITTMAAISKVSVEDRQGLKLPGLTQGETAVIRSELRVHNGTDQPADGIPYNYFVQIKASGHNPHVEYVGVYEGVFTADVDVPILEWTPENPGLFFMETYLWDRNNVPIAEKGPVVLIVVE